MSDSDGLLPGHIPSKAAARMVRFLRVMGQILRGVNVRRVDVMARRRIGRRRGQGNAAVEAASATEIKAATGAKPAARAETEAEVVAGAAVAAQAVPKG